MNDIEQATADFLAKQGATQCAAITSAKEAKATPRYTEHDARRSADAQDCAERNAENIRYDKEGVYYIGGKMVETKYEF